MVGQRIFAAVLLVLQVQRWPVQQQIVLMAVATAEGGAVLLRQRRPAALKIPQLECPTDDEPVTTPAGPTHKGLYTPVLTPVARPLFSCESEQQQAMPSRACVDCWLSVMEVTSKKSCSSASSSSCCSSAGSLAAVGGSAMQQDTQQRGVTSTAQIDLPPPAFVVLGLLSTH